MFLSGFWSIERKLGFTYGENLKKSTPWFHFANLVPRVVSEPHFQSSSQKTNSVGNEVYPSTVASKIFRIGHVQIDKTNSIGRKNIFHSVHLKFKYFNFCEIFFQGNQSDFFHVERSQGSKLFYKMAAPQLHRA